MSRHIVTRLLLRVGFLLATVGPAHAEVFKCVDQGGSVTFTDVPCKSQLSAGTEPLTPASEAAEAGAIQAAEADAVPAAPAPARAPAITRISLAASELPSVARQRQAVAARRPASQPFALDAATLKAARYTLTQRDSIMHQQKLAAR